MSEAFKVILTCEIAQLKNNIASAKKEISDLVKKTKNENKGFVDSFNKASEASKKALKTIGTAIAGAITALTGIAAATAEYRKNQDLLEASFQTAGAAAGTAKEVYNDLYRVLGDDGQATEAAQHLAQLTTEEQALSQWTTICQGVYASFGASLPIESLTEAANETAKTGELTGALADALNWAKLSSDQVKTAFNGNKKAMNAYNNAVKRGATQEEAFQAALDKCNTEAEREALIRQTLNAMYGEAAANYETNAAATLRQNEANAKLTEQLAKVGEVMAPILTVFTEFGTNVLAMITPYIENLAATYLPKLEEILNAVATAIGNVIGWVVDNWGIISTIGIIILAIATAFIVLQGAVALVNGVMTIMSMNPIVLIIAALAAIIAVCIIYWDEIGAVASAAWEAIVAAWNGAVEWFSEKWEGIKAAFAGVGEWFGTLFSGAWTSVETAWTGAKEWFGNVYKGITDAFSNVGTWFGDKFKAARNGVETAFSTAGTWAKDTWNKVKTGFSTADSWMGEKFGSAWSGIKSAFSPFISFFTQNWETVKGIFSVVKDVLSGNFKDAWNGIKGIFSSWGTFFSNLWDTVKKKFSNIAQSISEAMGGTIKSAVNGVLSGAVGIINGFISAINFAIDVINAIPGVSISKITPLAVPALAKGGIIDSATLALVGEQGKEAVVPLENNLEWLDKLASMLNDRMGGNQQIVLNVDGKQFAEISVDSINNLTRQRGSIPLVIA